jgi:hypothetical protein
MWKQWARVALFLTAFGIGVVVSFLFFPAGLVFYVALVLGWLLLMGRGSVDEEED